MDLPPGGKVLQRRKVTFFNWLGQGGEGEFLVKVMHFSATGISTS